MKQTVYQLITVHVQSALVGFAFYSKISHVAEECFNYAQTYTFRGGGGYFGPCSHSARLVYELPA